MTGAMPGIIRMFPWVHGRSDISGGVGKRNLHNEPPSLSASGFTHLIAFFAISGLTNKANTLK
jgi:hypothetical protein